MLEKLINRGTLKILITISRTIKNIKKDQLYKMTSRANPGELDRLAVSVLLQQDNDNLGEKTRVLVELVMRYSFYVALIAIILMIIALIVKLMWNFDGDEGGRARPINETTRLLFSSPEAKGSSDRKVVVTLYGTNEEEGDLESGGSEDWYDGKICVICYDDPRNCFFIPCGHCVSCINCAHRIVNEEIKSCPICRGIIDRVRKLRVL